MAELTEIRVARWLLGVDLVATRQAFAELVASDMPETGCDCAYCRNFAAAFPAPFPPEALELFKQLGMEARYPSEVVYYCRTENQPGGHYYGGWFHFIGQVLDGAVLEDRVGTPAGTHWSIVRDFELLGSNFAICFTKESLPKPKVFHDQQIVALEFETTVVPWVLDEPEPDY